MNREVEKDQVNESYEKALQDRPVHKIREHLEDALIHLHNAHISKSAKAEITQLLQRAAEVLSKAVAS